MKASEKAHRRANAPEDGNRSGSAPEDGNRSGSAPGDGNRSGSAPGERLMERELHLDLMKCFAMGMMPFFHVFSMCQIEGLTGGGFPPPYLTGTLGLLYNFTPGVFLFCLGCCVPLTRRGSPERLAARGLDTIRQGLRLNLLRFSLYYLAVGLAFSDPAALARAWFWFLGSDILPCAGMSFCLLARLRGRSEWAALGAALACAWGQRLEPKRAMPGTWGHILGNFLPVRGGESYFPFLPWAAFPCLGYFYQTRLRRCTDPDRLHLRLGAVCAGLLAGTAALWKRQGRWTPHHLLWGVMDFRLDGPALWVSSLTGGVWLSLSWFAAKKLGRWRGLRRTAGQTASAVNRFYCLHWLLLMLGIALCRFRRSGRVLRNLRDFLAAGGALLGLTALLLRLRPLRREAGTLGTRS